MPSIITLDVETKHLADEVGGWGHIRALGLSVAVTYDAESASYRTYFEEQVPDLVAELRGAALVIGYNILRFDYEVLRAYTNDPLDDLPTVDILQDLYRALNWRPKLDDVASATLGEHKQADGVLAVEWFRAGQIQRVVDYCRHDVEVTWRVYDFGCKQHYVQILDRWRGLRRVPVAWR